MDKSSAPKDEHGERRPDADQQSRDELKLPDERIDDLEPESAESGTITGGAKTKWSEITL